MAYVVGDAAGVQTYTIVGNGRTIIWKNAAVGSSGLGEYFIEVTAMTLGFALSGGTATIQRSFLDKADPNDATPGAWENMRDDSGNLKTMAVGNSYAFVTKIPYVAINMVGGGAGINLVIKVQ